MTVWSAPAAVIGASLPIVTAFLLLQATRWDRTSEPAPPALLVALAVGLGLGLGACAFFLALAIFNAAPAGVVAVDVALLIGAAVAARRHGARLPRASPPRPITYDRCLAAAVLVAAVAAIAAFAANTLADPHGQWDAWAIWNLRARWLFRAGPLWRTAFTESTMHGDYPLLLPMAIARVWVYSGVDLPGVPAALAAAYAAALVLLLYGALAAQRGRTQGLLGALALLGTPLFLRSAAWQYADIPLAFAMLATLALLALREHDTACGPTALAWAGFAAGLAAWTKNEGLLFLLCLAAVRGALARDGRHAASASASVAWFVAGLLLPATQVFAFKLTLATPSDLFAGQQAGDVLARIVDLARYEAIARATGTAAVRDGGVLLIALAAYAALLGRTNDQLARRAASAAALVIGGVALGYAAVYLVTPSDLEWQLDHSIDRLVLQLWPSALFALFLVAADPTERAAGAIAGAHNRSAPQRIEHRKDKRRRPRG